MVNAPDVKLCWAKYFCGRWYWAIENFDNAVASSDISGYMDKEPNAMYRGLKQKPEGY